MYETLEFVLPLLRLQGGVYKIDCERLEDGKVVVAVDVSDTMTKTIIAKTTYHFCRVSTMKGLLGCCA